MRDGTVHTQGTLRDIQCSEPELYEQWRTLMYREVWCYRAMTDSFITSSLFNSLAALSDYLFIISQWIHWLHSYTTFECMLAWDANWVTFPLQEAGKEITSEMRKKSFRRNMYSRDIHTRDEEEDEGGAIFILHWGSWYLLLWPFRFFGVILIVHHHCQKQVNLANNM